MPIDQAVLITLLAKFAREEFNLRVKLLLIQLLADFSLDQIFLLLLKSNLVLSLHDGAPFIDDS